MLVSKLWRPSALTKAKFTKTHLTTNQRLNSSKLWRAPALSSLRYIIMSFRYVSLLNSSRLWRAPALTKEAFKIRLRKRFEHSVHSSCEGHLHFHRHFTQSVCVACLQSLKLVLGTFLHECPLETWGLLTNIGCTKALAKSLLYFYFFLLFPLFFSSSNLWVAHKSGWPLTGQGLSHGRNVISRDKYHWGMPCILGRSQHCVYLAVLLSVLAWAEVVNK